jgi:outer membrane receptor protein involved in Fe transport
MPLQLKIIALATGLFLSLFYLPVQATPSQEQAKIQELVSLDLSDLLNVQITVASKTAETVANAPSSVTVFTHRQIQRMGVRTLGELLDFVPGFQSFRLALNGDSQGFQVRGNPMLPVFTRDVLILLDGRRLNGSHSGGAVLYNAYLNLDNVKQIEVIRGPGSALYGSNAFLGVINIISAKDRSNFIVRGGSHEAREALFNLSTRYKTWQFSSFARVYGDQGETYEGLTDRFGASGSATDERRGEDVNVRLNKDSFAVYLRHSRRSSHNFLDSEYLGDNDINTAEQKQSSLAFAYEYPLSSALTVKLKGGYSHSQLYFLSDAGDGLFGLYLENEATNFDLDAKWAISTGNTWQAGFTVEHTGNSDNALIERGADGELAYLRGADSFTENRTRDIIGLYIQHQRRLQPDLNLVGGVRYDRYSDFGDTVNPRGALVYDTPWQDKLKFMYGQAFRAPNLADLTLNVENSKGNPNLAPEKVETLELAYVHRASFGQAITTLFRNHISDVIAIEADENGLFFARNEGELTRHGLELELNIEAADDWLLRFTYTEIFAGADRHAPARFGSFIANHKLGDWNFNLNGTYQSPISSLENPQHTWLTHASVRYQFDKNIALQASVRNLSDKIAYDPPEFTTLREDARLHGIEPGIPNRGRVFWLGLEMYF